jgi:hypothetical protein
MHLAVQASLQVLQLRPKQPNKNKKCLVLRLVINSVINVSKVSALNFALCCSKSGYLFAFEVYTGKDNTADESVMATVMQMPRGNAESW